MSSSTNLILVAHGSRREASNDEVRRLTQQVAAGSHHQHVGCGFLELADPDIPTAIAQEIDRGATRILILPYFLSAGRHVTEDIPAILEKARQLHPDTHIQQLPYVGQQDGMIELLRSAAEKPQVQ